MCTCIRKRRERRKEWSEKHPPFVVALVKYCILFQKQSYTITVLNSVVQRGHPIINYYNTKSGAQRNLPHTFLQRDTNPRSSCTLTRDPLSIRRALHSLCPFSTAKCKGDALTNFMTYIFNKNNLSGKKSILRTLPITIRTVEIGLRREQHLHTLHVAIECCVMQSCPFLSIL